MTDLLRVEHLTRHFKIGGALSQRTLHAVDDVSFGINEREIVALAGESGSGKSTIARMLARIYRPTSGEIYFEGKPLSRIRSRRDQLRYSGLVPMVFQDPFASINPVFRVQHGVLRSLKLHRPELSAAQRLAEAARVFDVVGLNADMLQRFPYELSGGQRQRVGFAQALAMRPKLILADEPVSMLDVSIRIGLLNLMAKLRDEEGVSVLYITHDIASARYVADRLIVMYAGQIAETGPIEDVLAHPRHPYTQLLLSAVPDPRAPLSVGRRRNRPRRAAQGDRPGAGLPVPLAVPAGHRHLRAGHAGARRVASRSRRGLPRCPDQCRGSEGVLMKLAVIGGGSTYTPELADGIGRLLPQVTEFVLVDPDPSRLAAVGPVSARIMAAHGHPARVRWTGSLDEGADGADAILFQLRIGGQAARQRDETWPLDCGCVGQETTGAGGLAKALRTVPIVLDLAERARRRASPSAFIIDFTNPVGIVTRALLSAGHRAVGLCNVAIGFQRDFASLLGVSPDRVSLGHVGLNHLTWERSVSVDGVDVLPELLDKHADEIAPHTGMAADFIRHLGMVPSYYLRYYYAHDAVVESLRGAVTRAEEVARLETELLELYADPALDTKPAPAGAARRRVVLRGGGGPARLADQRPA